MGRQTNPLSFPYLSCLLILFISASIPFNPRLSLSICISYIIVLISLHTQIGPTFPVLPPSLLSLISPKTLQFLNAWTPSCPPFHPTFIVLCVIFSPSPIHFEFSPFFANSLQSHYLSPSIVLVVDYVIRAEDMSFLLTRSSAQ